MGSAPFLPQKPANFRELLLGETAAVEQALDQEAGSIVEHLVDQMFKAQALVLLLGHRRRVLMATPHLLAFDEAFLLEDPDDGGDARVCELAYRNECVTHLGDCTGAESPD